MKLQAYRKYTLLRILLVLFLISRNDLCCPCLYDFSIGFWIIQTVWYFWIIQTVWYFCFIQTVWYIWIIQTVWYFWIIQTVWYFCFIQTVVFLFFIVLSINPEKSWNITWFDVLCWKVRPRESHSTNLQYSIIHHLSMSSTVSCMKRNTWGCNNQETTYIFHLC